MPTGAKLVAAIALAIVAFFCGEQVRLALPEEMPTTFLSPALAVIGGIIGWRTLGGFLGRGFARAAMQGVMASAVFVLAACAAFAIRATLLAAWGGAFDTLSATFTDGIRNFLAFLTLSSTPAIIGILLVGGVLAGLVAEVADRRWN